jgi:hypothetical protein
LFKINRTKQFLVGRPGLDPGTLGLKVGEPGVYWVLGNLLALVKSGGFSTL